MAGGGPPDSGVLLVRRLLWNRDAGRRPRPLPVVHLLGPWGAGKTAALRAISEDCGGGTVHASFDFQGAVGASTTVAILAELANDLGRKWTYRPSARFTRFTLGWIAAQTPLDGLSRDQARERLRARIDELTSGRRTERIAELIGPMADTAAKADPRAAVAMDVIKRVLPSLIKGLGRRRFRRAEKKWWPVVPEAEGADALDALVTLNRRARTDSGELTALLTLAFLADVRENHSRMARPDVGSRCQCDHDGRHWHNWVLLLDNVDHQSGPRFLEDILTARRRHLHEHEGDHDPLLIVATDGRWNSQWEPVWRPIWKHAPAGAGPELHRTVMPCLAAKYEHWAAQPTADPRSPHFPVRLEPLSQREIASVLGVSASSRACGLLTRATGGLPAAVDRAKDLLNDGGTPPPGTRDVLEPTASRQARANLWRRRLTEARVDARLSAVEIDIERVVTAAPFATAPWLLSEKAINRIQQPDIGQILTELRSALWVTVPDDAVPDEYQATAEYAELHPWIARGLISALVHRDTAAGLPTFAEQFTVLLEDSGARNSPVREAYCKLALGQTREAVRFLEEWFDTVTHREWVNGLKLVTSAPDDMAAAAHGPAARTTSELYHRIVDEEFRAAGIGSPPIRNTVTRLVVAEWLAGNRFGVPDRDQNALIANAYRSLIPLSRRADVAALAYAADAAEQSQWY